MQLFFLFFKVGCFLADKKLIVNRGRYVMSLNELIIRNLTGPPIQPSKAAVGTVNRKEKGNPQGKNLSQRRIA